MNNFFSSNELPFKLENLPIFKFDDTYITLQKYLSASEKCGFKFHLTDINSAANFKRNFDLLMDLSSSLGNFDSITSRKLQEITNYKPKPFVERIEWLYRNNLVDMDCQEHVFISLTKKGKEITSKISDLY